MSKNDDQKIIRDIFRKYSDINIIYESILNIYPDYISNKEITKIIYEQVEWIFHDLLWTLFEYLVHNELISKYSTKQEKIDISKSIASLKSCAELYSLFFKKNEFKINYYSQIENIAQWAKNTLWIIETYIKNKKISEVKHSPRDWNNLDENERKVRDVYVILEDKQNINISLKTDKSWKMAVWDWQTAKIQEKVYSRYFNLSYDAYDELKIRLFWTKDEKIIFNNFQNIAYLTQEVIIQQFWLINAEVNNLIKAEITNIDTLKHCIKQLKIYKNWKDNSIVLVVNRLTWVVTQESMLDTINVDTLISTDFSFTRCKPKKDKYGVEPTIKYKKRAFVSFQSKPTRWNNPSEKFSDITTRLRIK